MRVRHVALDYAPEAARRRVRPARGFSDHRKGCGGRPKLTDLQVLAMRRAGDWGWPAAFIADLFGVGVEYARLVMNGESHAHVR